MATHPLHEHGLERRVSELYDFSLDINRHDSDLAFARSGGTIHYVIDENVLELFVNPSKNYSYVMRDAPRRSTSRPLSDREKQAMQSALFTAEVLLGGELPGQRERTCYMTEWHRWEALERVSEFIAETARAEPAHLKAAMSAAFKAKAALAENGDLADVGAADPYLNHDLARLKGQFGVSDEIADRMARVRATAALLARDRSSEPIHQLDRVLRFDLHGQIALATNLRDPDRKDVVRIARDAAIWHRAIRNEAEGRAARFNTANRKSRSAIWNDAQSMALIDWISRQFDPSKERVVFVTGDPTLFDAYRRTYESDAHRGQGRMTPFLLRRPIQYSTLFSVDDETMGGIRSDLFYSLQQLVELPLTPMRIASVGANGLGPDVLHRRNSLTLGRIGRAHDRRPYFNDVWRAFGDEYRPEQIESVERQIEETERFLNGLSGHLVERRIGEDHKAILSVSTGDSDARESLVEAYVERAVDALMNAALEIWLPEAEGFFRRAALEGPKLSRRRVPLALMPERHDTSRGELLATLDALFEDPIEEGSGGHAVAFGISSSFDIFLGAAAVALHGNEWRLGDHFCEVAINAFTHLSKYEGTSDAHAAEAHYLAALAKRFRMGDVRLKSYSDVYGAERLFDKAMALLRRSEELAGHAGSGFVAYRAFSERAALCLFHAVQLHHFASRSSSAKRYEEVGNKARDLFHDAGVCLTEALKIEERSGYRYETPNLYGSPHERLRLQILVNIAAWHALKPIIGANEADRPELARECALSLGALDENLWKANSALFDVELNAFRISQGLERSVRVAAASEVAPMVTSSRLKPGVLEVDRLSLELISAHWSPSLKPDRSS